MESFSENSENTPSKIIFRNQPKLSGHEADKKYDERREALISEIESFVSSDELFEGKEVSIEFSHNGVSSLVAFIETGDEKFVLKIPLSLSGNEGEGEFLRAWEEVGVKVPHVVKEGNLGAHSYLLMDYIDAPTLSEAVKDGLVKEDTAFKEGQILRKMHTTKAEGYGLMSDGKPEYETFKEWLFSEEITKMIEVVQENNLLGDEHGPIKKALEVLIDYVGMNPESTYCHFDYGSSNMLATEPLTVIDPDPIFNNGIIDIGRSILLTASGGHAEAAERLKEGYFEDSDIDTKALQAAIILNAYLKIAYWHKKGKIKSVKNVQKYLAETSGLL